MRQSGTLSDDVHGKPAFFTLLTQEANHIGRNGVSQIALRHIAVLSEKQVDKGCDKSHNNLASDIFEVFVTPAAIDDTGFIRKQI